MGSWFGVTVGLKLKVFVGNGSALFTHYMFYEILMIMCPSWTTQLSSSYLIRFSLSWHRKYCWLLGNHILRDISGWSQRTSSTGLSMGNHYLLISISINHWLTSQGTLSANFSRAPTAGIHRDITGWPLEGHHLLTSQIRGKPSDVERRAIWH